MSGRRKPTVVSLFAGCGGSSLGYRWAGFRELLAVDFDPDAVATFSLNFPEVTVWRRDIREITGRMIARETGLRKGRLDVLDGSPPCQGFSMSVKGTRDVVDPRNDLSFEFLRLVDELRPRAFIMENVRGMVLGKMRGVFKEVMREARGIGYQVECRMLDAMHYGVAQSRRRLIWIGGRDGPPAWPEPRGRPITVQEVWADLPKQDMPLWQRDSFMRWAWYRTEYGGCLAEYHPRGSAYNKLKVHPGRPCFTITRVHNIMHYAEPRYLSPMELKRVCSYPDDFRFDIPGALERHNAVERMGESVPPRFMEAIARAVKKGMLV